MKKILLSAMLLTGMSVSLSAEAAKNYKLGNAYRFGTEKITVDATKAIDYYKKDCDAGNMFSCYSLGSIYHEGLNEIKKNLSVAIQYYKKCCINGDADGCAGLGYTYREKGDKSNATKAFNKACEMTGNRMICIEAERG